MRDGKKNEEYCTVLKLLSLQNSSVKIKKNDRFSGLCPKRGYELLHPLILVILPILFSCLAQLHALKRQYNCLKQKL